MAANPNRDVSYTLQEYLDFENNTEEKHEFWGGEIFAAPRAGWVHTSLIGNITTTLHGQLRGRSLCVHASTQRLHIETADFVVYPDVVIADSKDQLSQIDSLAIFDAVVIVEVLSAATEKYDRGPKFDIYRQLASLRHYVLVETDRVGVEHRFREKDGEWITERFASLAGRIDLSAVACRLDIRDVYDEIEF